ncbi:MAG: glutamyl-tRNA reductase, partial [Phycisphaerae bacterium]|nr:glutamyl-tRNA reductase [Phycisphaerae bacterium]
MRILCVGISHKTADIALREKLAFDVAGRAEALARVPQRWSDAEFAILSTCNRVEIYTARPVHGHPREQELVEFLGQFHDVPS